MQSHCIPQASLELFVDGPEWPPASKPHASDLLRDGIRGIELYTNTFQYRGL